MLKLHTKDVPVNEPAKRFKIISIRNYFVAEIRKTRIYKEYIIKYHSYDNPETDEEKCFKKFAVGKPENHVTDKIDINRLKRMHWIHNILDYMISNDFQDPSGLIKITSDSIDTTRDKFNLYIIYEKYNYVVMINVRKPFMIVSSGFYSYDGKGLQKFLRYFNANI
ncbi:MAG: hypothetical protein RBQ71_02945 [Acholeplasmataceae bacterium]|jgi:hypothetical protein|nr:hypothetical protein [Acholeplasmataceae bacterium]